MIVQLTNYQTQNLIFFILLALAVILTTRRKTDNTAMSIATTNELKGLAILAIIFSHVGYFLTTNNQFLFPLSTWSGVGVNLFFFLSAFGLTMSALRVKASEDAHAARKKDLSIGKFYLKRLSRVIIPVWIFLIIFLLLDKFALDLTYPLATTIKNFFGFFPRANLYLDINSPLWFITPLIFYYLLFPILFRKKIPELTALALYIISYYLVTYFVPLSVDAGVKGFWQIHYLAFPLGILFASLLTRLKNYQPLINIKNKIVNKKPLTIILNYLFLILLILAWLYFFKNSGVGEAKNTEQFYSLVAMFITIFIFILKPIKNQFLNWLGIFSFEIYLLHWPLMYRYDFIFRFLPAGIAMFLYLLLFIGIGWGIKNYLPKLNLSKIWKKSGPPAL